MSATWLIETIGVAKTCQAEGVDYGDPRGFVRLGNGKTVYAQRKGIQLGPGFPWQPDAKQSR